MKQSRRAFVATLGAVGMLRAQQSEPVRAELIAGGQLAGILKDPAQTLAILPLGSIEYHGPGAALGTDALLGASLAERVWRRLTGSAVLFPVVSYTHSPAHTRAFAGTISIRPEAVTMYLEDVLRGMVGMGFRRIFVLNAHDGNVGPGRSAVSQVANEPPHPHILFLNWWESMPGELVDSMHLFTQPNGGHGHGGPFELSAVAAVNPAALVKERGADLPAPPALSQGFPYYLEKSAGRDWPGYSGKVSEASREKGEKIIALATDRIVDLVKRWIANSEAPGAW